MSGGPAVPRPGQPVCATLHRGQSEPGHAGLVVILRWCIAFRGDTPSFSLPSPSWYTSVPDFKIVQSFNILLTIPSNTKNLAIPQLRHSPKQLLTLLHQASPLPPSLPLVPKTHLSTPPPYLPAPQLPQHISLPNTRHMTPLHL